MKFLPFTISIGKSLDRMLDEQLEQEDLARQIKRMQKRGNEDFAIRTRPRTLPLREILYKDIERPDRDTPYDSDRVIVRAYSCGLEIPNCPITSEDEIHYDNSSSQRQVIVTEDLLLVRDVSKRGIYPQRASAEILSCYMKPFTNQKDNKLDYKMIESFTREVFDDKEIIARTLGNKIGTIGGSRDDKEFGKFVYEIRLIVPSEPSRQPHDLYGNSGFLIRKELDNLGYEKHEGSVCLA